MTSIRLMRSGLAHVLFVHVLQSRPWNALHYWPVASDKLKVGGFRFFINVHHGQYPVVALNGNAVVFPWNAECHAPSLRHSRSRSRRAFQSPPLPAGAARYRVATPTPISCEIARQGAPEARRAAIPAGSAPDGRRPSRFPMALAFRKPARTRSWISDRSNSAIAPMI